MFWKQVKVGRSLLKGRADALMEHRANMETVTKFIVDKALLLGQHTSYEACLDADLYEKRFSALVYLSVMYATRWKQV